MKPVHLLFLAFTCASMAAPLACAAAPSIDAAATCSPSLTPLQQRINENAAAGLPSLIAFVNRTKPIYQLDLVETVAWLDAERARRAECELVSARSTAAR